MKISEVMALIDAIAPFETQADFDNSGLLTGHPAWEVSGIHTALDVTHPVLDEAEAAGANLLITHHPLMFSPRKSMTEADYEGSLLCRMIRARMGLIAVHTNLDAAAGGVNDALAAALGLQHVTGAGYWRVGDLETPACASAVAAFVSERLRTTVRVMGQPRPDRLFRRMGVSSGAGGDSWEDVLALGADIFITGEMKHHLALAAADSGLLVLEAGHFATEEPGIFALADALQSAANQVQWNLRITKSACRSYTVPAGRG